MGKLIPALEADLQRREKKLIKDRLAEYEKNGEEYLGDEDDLIHDDEDGEGDTIPGEVAWTMFKRYNHWSDAELDAKPDCQVFRAWRIFQYMLATGMLTKYAI